jgi:hypothetical protein
LRGLPGPVGVGVPGDGYGGARLPVSVGRADHLHQGRGQRKPTSLGLLPSLWDLGLLEAGRWRGRPVRPARRIAPPAELSGSAYPVLATVCPSLDRSHPGHSGIRRRVRGNATALIHQAPCRRLAAHYADAAGHLVEGLRKAGPQGRSHWLIRMNRKRPLRS